MREITHRPKGSMCVNCRAMNDRNHKGECPTQAQFQKMKVIGHDKSDGMVVVKCERFERY